MPRMRETETPQPKTVSLRLDQVVTGLTSIELSCDVPGSLSANGSLWPPVLFPQKSLAPFLTVVLLAVGRHESESFSCQRRGKGSKEAACAAQVVGLRTPKVRSSVVSVGPRSSDGVRDVELRIPHTSSSAASVASHSRSSLPLPTLLRETNKQIKPHRSPLTPLRGARPKPSAAI